MTQHVILYSYLTNYYKVTVANNIYGYSKRIKYIIPDNLDYNKPYLYISEKCCKHISLDAFISDYLNALNFPDMETYIHKTPCFEKVLERYNSNPTFHQRTIESKRKTLIKWISKHILIFKLIKITPYTYLNYLGNRSIFNLKPDIVSEVIQECSNYSSDYNKLCLYGNNVNKAKCYLAESLLYYNPESTKIVNISKDDGDISKQDKLYRYHIYDLSKSTSFEIIGSKDGNINQCNSFIMFTHGEKCDLKLLSYLIRMKEEIVKNKILILLQNIFIIKDIYPIIKETKYQISQLQTRNYRVNNSVFSTTFSDTPNDCILITINN